MYLKEISFEHTNLPQYPQDFPLPTLPNIRNKTFKDGTETRAKEAEHVNSSLGPEALHQELNIIEIAVVLVIGATTAIGLFFKLTGILSSPIPQPSSTQFKDQIGPRRAGLKLSSCGANL